ncbi:MAG: hydroxymethylbilane synthase [Planctomycetota bacterium]
MSEPAPRTLRLGTRASKLARWQSDWVAARLRSLGQAVEIVEIQTSGDAQQSGPIGAIGLTGVFTKEIQRALLDRRVDLAVHSLKDLPTAPVEGLTLAATPEREGVRDALISPVASSLDALPKGARVGTGSFRRKAQLLHHRPDLQVLDLRGNVDTRLRKLDEGQYDAILLAEAGLRRLGFASRITQAIATEVLLPAPGQGALGLECRADNATVVQALAPLNHMATRAAVDAERAALARLEGGCLAALGAHGRIEQDGLRLSVVVMSEDGRRRLLHEAVGESHAAIELGNQVAEHLLDCGAAALLRSR